MPYDAFISYSHAADSQLAPKLQDGLQRMARPWWRRRALHIFRDNTGLTANPALWSSISSAIDDSEWFVFLASPEAAASPWVQREIDHWLEHRGVDHLLPVVTDGEWAWDSATNDFDWARCTAVPIALRGVFREEPRHIDLRWAHSEDQLDLHNPHFRDDVAAVSAPIHGLAKDELVGEDIRQHRRTMRWAWGAAVALILLTAGSAMATVLAVRNADAADSASAEAQANAAQADASATEADQQKAVADANARRAADNAEQALANANEADQNAADAQQQQALAEQNADEASQQRSAAEASALDAAAQAAEAARQARAALDAKDAESAARADAEAETQRALRAEADANAAKEDALAQEGIANTQRAAAEVATATARQAQQTAETQALASASAAEGGTDSPLALLLAVEATNRGATASTGLSGGVSLQSLSGSDSAVGRRALFEAVTQARGGTVGFPVDRFVAMAGVDDPPALLWRPAVSPDGRWLAAAEFPDLSFGPQEGEAPRLPTFPSRVFVWDLSVPSQPVRVLSGHDQAVATVIFAGNDTLVTQDLGDLTDPDSIVPPTTRVWDLANGTTTHVRHGVPYVSPDRRFIAIRATDGATVEFVDARTRRTTVVQPGVLATDPLDGFRPEGADPIPAWERPFSRDGRYALGESYGVAVLWDLNTGGRVAVPLITPDGFYSEAPTIDPTGSVASALVDGTYLTFFQASDGVPLESYEVAGPTEFPIRVVWSPDGSRFAILIYDFVADTARVLAVGRDGAWSTPLPLGRLAYTSDGGHLAIEIPIQLESGVRVYQTGLFDADTGELQRVLDGQLITTARVDGSLLFVQHYSDDGHPHLFIDDLHEDRTLMADDPARTVVAVTTDPQQTRLAVATDDGVVRLWDRRDGTGARRTVDANRLQLGLVFDPDSVDLTGVGIGPRLTRWDTSKVGGAEILGTTAPGADILEDGVTVAEPTDAGTAIVLRNLSSGTETPGPALAAGDHVDQIAVAANGGPLVANGKDADDAEVAIVARPDGDVVGRLPGRVAGISHDGKRLALRRPQRNIDVVEVEGLRVVTSIDLATLPPGSKADDIALDPTGRRIAATNTTGAVAVWDVATGAVVFRADGSSVDERSYPLAGLSFSPTGDRLAVKSPSNLVRMWDTESGGWPLLANEQLPIDQFAGRIVFGPDGDFIGVDGLYVLDGHTLDTFATLLTAPGSSTRFASDGRWLITISQQGEVQRWSTSVSALTGEACRLAGRNLTRTEFSRYLPNVAYRPTCAGYPLED